MSKKLRTLMKLVSIEAPAARVAAARKALKFCDALLSVTATGDALQIVTNKLIQALAQHFRLLARASHHLFINRQSYIHKHSICAQVSGVNWSPRNEKRCRKSAGGESLVTRESIKAWWDGTGLRERCHLRSFGHEP